MLIVGIVGFVVVLLVLVAVSGVRAQIERAERLVGHRAAPAAHARGCTTECGKRAS